MISHDVNGFFMDLKKLAHERYSLFSGKNRQGMWLDGRIALFMLAILGIAFFF